MAMTTPASATTIRCDRRSRAAHTASAATTIHTAVPTVAWPEGKALPAACTSLSATGGRARPTRCFSPVSSTSAPA
jgi:hypothetical protein